MTARQRASRLFLGFMALTLAACICPTTMLLPVETAAGTLAVDITYSGDFYTETFNYAPDAPNIRHFVLVLPEAEADNRGDLANPDWIFTSIELPADGSVAVREDRQDYAWAFDYLYEAPEGHLELDVDPGTYVVAGAFLAAPLSRDEAGVDSDVILWPGVTGGGANSDLQTVIDGYIIIQLREEKAEISYIDALALDAGGTRITADGVPELAAIDGDYLTLGEGDVVELRFMAPASFESGDSVSVIAAGYYVPA